MKRGILAALLGAALLFAAACKSKTEDNEAVRQGVMKYLAGRGTLNVNNMDVKVTQATINGSQAQAQVEIRSKGGDPNAAPMQIGYALEKQGNEWVVLKSTGMGGGMQHPGPGETPSGSMPGAMPPGHPNVTGGAGQSSGDHPDFNAILNGAQGSSSQPAPPQTPPASNSKP